MPTMDRRHALRTKLDQLAYISIEPDNGGIVLNVSGEGLGFHSMVPVKRKGALCLSLQQPNRRIDICGELMWTDEVQTTGGVRFTTLTAEARDRILDWAGKPDGVAGARFSLGSALLRALSKTDSPRFAGSFTSALDWWKWSRRLRVSGFSRGLITGVLLSLIAFSVVLFSYGHRRELGEFLIHLGKRLAANGDSQAPSRPTAPPPVTVTSRPTSRTVIPIERNPSPVKATFGRRSAHSEAKPVPQTAVLPALQRPHAMPSRSKLGPDNTDSPNLSGVKSPASEQPPAIVAAAKPAAIGTSLAPMPEQLLSIAKPERLPTSMHSEPAAVGLSRAGPAPRLQMFFDLGRFKKEWLAQQLSNELSQLGFNAAVAPRRHLWTTFYHVLVGPYDDEAAEKQINNELVSHGYKPRPFERGTREFVFRSRVTVDRSQLPTGDLMIAWESYIADAKVKFTHGRDLLAAVDGKWVKRAAKFSQNEYVYQIQADGARPLLEIHFEGMERALVFRNLP